MRARWIALVAATILGAPAVARADQPLPFPELPQGSEPVVEPGHWARESARPFFSIRTDLGYLYLKPRLSVGYGKPFDVWGGLDVVPFVTPNNAGGYSGLHLRVDWFDLRAGARFMHSFFRQYLAPRASYTLVDLSEDVGRTADYVALEAEASAAIPAGPGNILALFTAESIQFVPPGSYVFDETLHVVVSPPPVYRGRLGYSFVLGTEHVGRLGLVGEVIEIPDRSAQVYRAGLIASFDIDSHLQLVGTVLIPVYGPDSLGLLGADYTEIGIRYRWATGHSHMAHEAPGSASP